jgi:hypothetical protein
MSKVITIHEDATADSVRTILGRVQKINCCLLFALAIGMMLASGRADARRVEDVDTHQPLPGTYVITVWNAQVYKVVQSSHECFHVDVSQTNSLGEYETANTPGHAPNLYEVRSRLVLYREGYRALEPLSQAAETLVMRRDNAPRIDRMAYMISLAEEMVCGSVDEQRALIPVFKHIYDEMNATTNRSLPELKALNDMQYMIDILEVGQRQARKAWNQRKAAWGIQ